MVASGFMVTLVSFREVAPRALLSRPSPQSPPPPPPVPPLLATLPLRCTTAALALILGWGCSAPSSGVLPGLALPAGIDAGDAIRVTYLQQLPSPLHLSLENRRFAASSEGAGHPGASPSAKVVRNEDIAVLLVALDRVGFFDIASPGAAQGRSGAPPPGSGAPPSPGAAGATASSGVPFPSGVPWRIEVAAGTRRFVADFQHEGRGGSAARHRMESLVASKRVFHEFFASTFALQAVRNPAGVRIFEEGPGAGGDRRRRP